MLILFVSCSPKKDNDNRDAEIENNSNSDIIVENDAKSQKEVLNDLSVIVSSKAINIRTTPNVGSNDNVVGQANMGDTYKVLEKYSNDNYVWYKIGDNKWIANDGSWCIEYGEYDNDILPHVMNDKEINDFLLSIETYSAIYSNPHYSKHLNLNIFQDPNVFFDSNIVFSVEKSSVNESYKYIVKNIVQMDNDIYDVYVLPVYNNGVEDFSTGILRFSNIGTEPSGPGEDETLSFNMTLIQNNNDTSDSDLKELYNVDIHYTRSHLGY